MRLEVDFASLESVLGLVLPVHLETGTQVVEVTLGVGLELKLHVTLILLKISEVFPLHSLVLDLLLFELIGDVFDLELYELVDRRSRNLERIDHHLV